MLWISPFVVTELDGGGGGGTAPVGCISPARAPPESTHARVIANAKRLICLFLLEFEDASQLARKQNSVNTYRAIDTASCAVSNIERWQSKDFLHSLAKVYLIREDSLT